MVIKKGDFFSALKEQALDMLIYKKPNNQICITSQELLDRNLHYVKSIIL